MGVRQSITTIPDLLCLRSAPHYNAVISTTRKVLYGPCTHIHRCRIFSIELAAVVMLYTVSLTDDVVEMNETPTRTFGMAVILHPITLQTLEKIVDDRGSRSDWPRYHAYTRWTPSLPLATPRRTPRHVSAQLMTHFRRHFRPKPLTLTHDLGLQSQMSKGHVPYTCNKSSPK